MARAKGQEILSSTNDITNGKIKLAAPEPRVNVSGIWNLANKRNSQLIKANIADNNQVSPGRCLQRCKPTTRMGVINKNRIRKIRIILRHQLTAVYRREVGGDQWNSFKDLSTIEVRSITASLNQLKKEGLD